MITKGTTLRFASDVFLELVGVGSREVLFVYEQFISKRYEIDHHLGLVLFLRVETSSTSGTRGVRSLVLELFGAWNLCVGLERE
jgi:hypothetical protein